MPPPYELVRHSVLALLPAAPFGHRSWLPAAEAACAVASSTSSAAAGAHNLRTLDKGGAHQQSLGVRQRQWVPDTGARDEGQRRRSARREERRDASARGNPLQGCDAEQHDSSICAHDLDDVTRVYTNVHISDEVLAQATAG